ncbi:MAG: HAMP domain-containing histidine kinase [Alphaproteobacteria bacterium]
METPTNDEQCDRILRGQRLAGVVLVCYDSTLRCLYASNMSAEGTSLRSTADILAPADAEVVDALIREVMRSGVGTRVGLSLRFAPDFEPRWYDLTVEPVAIDGMIIETACAAVDVTDWRDCGTALNKSRAEAREAARAAWRFIASASHDLRQPFQAMRLFQYLLENRLVDPECRDLAAKLGEAMTAGERLLNALLDVSALDAGAIEPKVESFSMCDVLARLGREFTGQATGGGLVFRLVQPAGLVVRTDPVLLERILRNLLANALRYNRAGGSVLLGCRRTAKAVRVEVWNTGPGLPPDLVEALFSECNQTPRPVCDRRSGLGLGLPTVRRMAKLLDLPVSVRSKPGHWAMFGVTVPID